MHATPTSMVLVVEDDAIIREVLSDMLTVSGYAVEEAEDGQEAIDALERHSPPQGSLNLVLLDMMLPRVNGSGVLQRWSELGNYVPVVAMSADAQQLRFAQAAGVQSVLHKPFDMPELLALVQRYSTT